MTHLSNSPTNPGELQALYPYQFSGQNIGISTTRGHFPLFAKLCHDIDGLLGNDKRGFHWSQVKEKYGSMRFHWSMQGTKAALHIDVIAPDSHVHLQNKAKASKTGSQPLTDAITSLVRDASSKTGSMCCVCGDAGKMDQTTGYVLVLCTTHTAMRKANPRKLPEIWWPLEEGFV